MNERRVTTSRSPASNRIISMQYSDVQFLPTGQGIAHFRGESYPETHGSMTDPATLGCRSPSGHVIITCREIYMDVDFDFDFVRLEDGIGRMGIGHA